MKFAQGEIEKVFIVTLVISWTSNFGETKIPSSILYEMKDIHSLPELLRTLPINAEDGIHMISTTDVGTPREPQGSVHVYIRNQVIPQEQFPVDVPALPACQPRPTIVKTDTLISTNDDILFWPHCLSVNKCDGCCNTDLFECVSTRTRELPTQLIRMEYDSLTNRLAWAGVTTVGVEEDVGCACKCKVRPHQCRVDREVFNNCQCHCVAQLECPPNFRWDPVTCDCVCDVPESHRLCRSKRETFSSEECSCTCDPEVRERCSRKGLRFNTNKCKCISRSRFEVSDSS